MAASLCSLARELPPAVSALCSGMAGRRLAGILGPPECARGLSPPAGKYHNEIEHVVLHTRIRMFTWPQQKPLPRGTIMCITSVAVLACSLAGAAPAVERPVLFGESVPPNALFMFPIAAPPSLVPFTAYREVVNVWGYPTACLHYNGRYARGQFRRAFARGKASLCVVEKDEVRESVFFLTCVMPVLSTPREPVETSLGPTELIAPKAAELQALRRNLLRVYFDSWTRGRDLKSQPLRAMLIRHWIQQVQYNGLLHEVQHVFSGYGPRENTPPPWEEEERSHLTAFRHSPSPQIALYQVLQQYDAGEGKYYQAVQDILENVVRRVAAQPERYAKINPSRNIMAQLDSVSPADLAGLSGQIMQARWEAWDAARGLSLEYDRPPRIDVPTPRRLEHPEPQFPATAPPPARGISPSPLPAAGLS